MNKKINVIDNFNDILNNLLVHNNQGLIINLFEYYYKNKNEIQTVFLNNKTNIINIDQNEFNLLETLIICIKSYKDVVTKFYDFIENFFCSTEEINENNIKKYIIDIIYYLECKDNIKTYIKNIPEHNSFFYKNNLHVYDEKLILENCEKRMDLQLYKKLVINLVYYKIKNDIIY